MTKRVLLFTATTIGVLILIQTPLPVLLLRNIVSPSDAIRLTESLRSAVPGIIVALIVTLTYELGRDKQLSVDTQRSLNRIEDIGRKIEASLDREYREGGHEVLRQLAPRALVGLAIRNAYELDNRIDSLINAVITDRPIFRDVEIAFRLDAASNDGAWNIETQYRVTVKGLHTYLAGFCVGVPTFNQLINLCPNILHLQFFEDEDGRNLAVASLLQEGASAFQYMVADPDGNFGQLVNGRLSAVPEAEYSTYGVPTHGLSGESIVILRCHIDQGANRDVVLISRSKGQFPSSVRYCYYQEDRPAYVSRVIFDWSGLLDHPGREYTLIPFYFPKGPSPAIQPGRRRIEINVEQWLTPGQGILLAW